MVGELPGASAVSALRRGDIRADMGGLGGGVMEGGAAYVAAVNQLNKHLRRVVHVPAPQDPGNILLLPGGTQLLQLCLGVNLVLKITCATAQPPQKHPVSSAWAFAGIHPAACWLA
jgi:hypothetical protein